MQFIVDAVSDGIVRLVDEQEHSFALPESEVKLEICEGDVVFGEWKDGHLEIICRDEEKTRQRKIKIQNLRKKLFP